MKKDADKKTLALFFDIDGTILFHSRHFPLLVRYAIRKAQKMGHYVIINTGRSYSGLPKKVLAKIKWDGILCCAAYGEFKGKTVFSDVLTKENLTGLCAVVDKYQLPTTLDREHGESYHIHYKTPRKCMLKNACDVLDSYEEAKINKIDVDTKITEEIRDELRQFATPYNMGRYDDVFITGNNKGVAMLKMAEYLGIPQENTVAFGDNYNDYDMLAAAGTSVAMSTAPEKLRSVATYCEKSKRNGVYYAIKKILNF